MLASKLGTKRFVQILIGSLAELNHKSFSGRTALMQAADNNNLGCVKVLANNGADFNNKAIFWNMSLFFACLQILSPGCLTRGSP